MAVTDASIAANVSHGVIFVVGVEMTCRRVAQRAIEQLSHGQVRFLGSVLNRVNLRRATGTPLPPDVAVNAAGETTTDPHAAVALMPLVWRKLGPGA